MSDSVLRDRIALGIQSGDARERIFQERKLDLKRGIDICRASESATTHLQAFVGKHEESTGCTEWANDLSKKNLNRVNELKPHLKKKTPSYESWRASSAHSLVFWRKSYVPRGVNGAMFAVNKSLKGFKGLCHEGENRFSKSRFWLPWLGFGCDLWRLSTPLLMVSPQRKTNQSIVKCVSGLTQSDYKWLWSRC